MSTNDYGADLTAAGASKRLKVRWGGWVAGLIKTNTSPSKAELAAGRC